MTTRTAERIDEWESRPFEGGYAALRDLADASFSGVVTAGRATCCLLNGTIVGILDGTIEDLEDESGTIRKAPSPALPLLIVMQDRSDTVRAKYYSEETPLSEANRKLSDGGFTGYVELSENVLSGDYYVVYHGGRSMSVAYVGQSDQLLTDDEAFERADDEVGIYKVYPVDIEPTEVPEPEADDEPESVTAAGVDSGGKPPADRDDAPETATASPRNERDTESERPDTGTERPDSGTGRASESTPVETQEPEADEAVTGGVARREPSDAEGDRTGGGPDERGGSTESEPAETDDPRTAEGRDRPAGGGDQPSDRSAGRERDPAASGSRETPQSSGSSETSHSGGASDARTAPDTGETEGTRAESDARPSREDRASEVDPSRTDTPTSEGGDTRPQRAETGSDRADASPGRDPLDDDPLADAPDPATGSEDLERRSIPSVDPERTWTDEEDGPSSTVGAPGGADADIDQRMESASRSRGGSTDPSPAETQSRRTEQQGTPDLSTELREKEQTIDALEAELTDIEAERDQLAAENEDLETELRTLREKRDELQAEVERLQARIGELESEDPTVDADIQLSPTEAIEKTNLFVRYGSKGEATLESAHDRNAEKDDVEANLDLEYHTSFDAATAAVGDQAFEAFLTETIQYRFVEWVVYDLLYEILDTGHTDGLRDLFDALPKLDRAELDGAVSVTYTENGEEQRTQEPFDVVLRDRMGNPMVVASINDSREAATEQMMTDLVTRSTRAGESNDTLVGAFVVTASFFDPDALETAAEATGGGLLSRDKRRSFVRLGRKQGYHLCLVEAREGKFHLAVPEL